MALTSPDRKAEVKYSLDDFRKLKNSLARAGSVEIRLVSNSMAPLLPTGATARIEPCSPEDLSKYDIIVFWYHGDLTCHCFWSPGLFPAANGERTLVTKGLNNSSVDDPVHESWLLGKVVSHRTSAWQFNALLLKRRFFKPREERR